MPFGIAKGQQDPKTDAEQLKAQETVLALINELADKSTDKQDTAQRRLIALGTVALPLVKSVYEEQRFQGDAEQRLAKVFHELQASAIQDFLGDRPITMSGSFSLEGALKKLGELSGNEIKLTKSTDPKAQLAEPLKKIVVDFQGEPFWKVVDRLCDEHKLSVFPYGDSKALELRPGAREGLARQQNGQYAGPFRLEVISTSATRAFNNTALNGLRVTVQLCWEPRIKPLLFLLDNTSVMAECDNGVVLESKEEFRSEISPTLPTQAEFDLVLPLPPRESHKLERLAGKITASIPSEPVLVKFKGLDGKTPIERKVGSIVASVEDARINGEIIQVDLLLKLGDTGIRLDSFRNWLMVNEAHGYDGAGKMVNNLGWQTYLMNEKEVGITVNFDKKVELKDFQFEFSAPAALIDHPIEFVLDSITLP